MAGSKRERSPGVWELRVYLGRDPVTGRKRWCSRSFRGGSRAAERALAALAVEQQGSLVPTEKTISWLLDTWLRSQADAGLSPTTLRTYRGYAANWLVPLLGARSIASLTAGDVRSLHTHMTARGREPSTVHQVHSILRGALAFALEHEWVDRNVAAHRKAPRQEQAEVIATTAAEFAALIEGAGEPGSDMWTLVGLSAMLGTRAGELAALRWSDIDLASGTVRIERSAYEVRAEGRPRGERATRVKAPKSRRSTRRLVIDDLTADLLRVRWAWQLARRERIAPGGALVEDPYVLSRRSDGRGPPSPSALSRSFAHIRDELGLPHLHLHCQRHFMATYLLDQGVPLPVVAARLGHSSPAVTARIYAHAVAGRDAEAAGALGRLLPAKQLP